MRAVEPGTGALGYEGGPGTGAYGYEGMRARNMIMIMILRETRPGTGKGEHSEHAK